MMRSLQRYQIVCLSLLLLGLAIPVGVAMAKFSPVPQTNKTVNANSFRNQPMSMTQFFCQGKEISKSTPFLASDDWLKGLAVQVQNTSNKPVAGVFVDVIMGGIQSRNNHPMSIQLKYGYIPGLETPTPTMSKVVPKGNILMAMPATEYIKLLHAFGTQLGHINAVQMQVNSVFFEDGTAWQAGFNMHPGTHRGEWEVDQSSAKAVSTKKPFVKAAFFACPYVFTGTHVIDCCGSLVPTANYYYDPVDGNANLSEVTRLCGPPDYDECDYFIAGGCNPGE